jgi:hypothetical protein
MGVWSKCSGTHARGPFFACYRNSCSVSIRRWGVLVLTGGHSGRAAVGIRCDLPTRTNRKFRARFDACARTEQTDIPIERLKTAFRRRSHGVPLSNASGMVRCSVQLDASPIVNSARLRNQPDLLPRRCQPREGAWALMPLKMVSADASITLRFSKKRMFRFPARSSPSFGPPNFYSAS